MTEKSNASPPDMPGKPVFSLVVIALCKGVVQAAFDPILWSGLLELQARVREHMAPFGLELILDEAEGYAYLRQRSPAEGEPELPRLVPRRPLGYQISLLLVLLRKKLAEQDAQGDNPRLILDQEQIADMVRVFLPDTANEVRFMDRLNAHVNKIVEMGFLRRLNGPGEQFEVQRILKAFVDLRFLADIERRLAEHAQTLGLSDAVGEA
jgi:hypothetical protein